ncbi:cupin-like domain-containing protein [Taibaiella soli]|uniref:Transcriptional regulator n=1 Tax=Taibaiella soli TaxID=1649169 RepID=A0A2W2BEC3_9BACT|nr:cupin-like domain-containing protein [Taibaiella soli]PZF71946.1 transcriptional regulator [Taibaiella soli]
MVLTSIDRVKQISPEDFKKNYLDPQIPVIITNLSHTWPAFNKWNWDYFKEIVGNVDVGVYNNIRAGAHVPVNGNDGVMKFGDYLDLIRKGPVELRIFLFNVFKYAPEIIKDVIFPEQLTKSFLKKYPMLFVGGAGSIAHMHYDIDLSHIFHTQFIGRKRVLLLHNNQSKFIYKMPSTVESAASFVDWHESLDMQRFPALRYAHAYTSVLEHGETMFMPSGYWHHMQYLDSGFALSLRALPAGVVPKLNGLYHLLGMRGFNNMLIRFFPEWWYHYKRRAANTNAHKAMEKIGALA